MLNNDSFIEDYKLQSLRESARAERFVVIAKNLRSVRKHLDRYLGACIEVDQKSELVKLVPIATSISFGCLIPSVLNGVFHAVRLAIVTNPHHSHLSLSRLLFLINAVSDSGWEAVLFSLVGAVVLLLGLQLWNKKHITLSIAVLASSLLLSFVVSLLIDLAWESPSIFNAAFSTRLSTLAQFIILRSFFVGACFEAGLLGFLGGFCAGFTLIACNRRHIKLVSTNSDQNLLPEQQPHFKVLADEQPGPNSACKQE